MSGNRIANLREPDSDDDAATKKYVDNNDIAIWTSLITISDGLAIFISECLQKRDALGIPDTVMGLTLLAAGTSVPDCLASLFAARDGFGDMAVSNSIGSNVFDILACLGVPWLIDTIVNGKAISIRSGGLLYSSLTLLATVVYMLLGMFILKWKLNKKFGALCLIVYVIVTTITCLFELNIIGDFNKDNCA